MPRKPKKQPGVYQYVAMSPAMRRTFVELARRKERNVADVIREALYDWLTASEESRDLYMQEKAKSDV